MLKVKLIVIGKTSKAYLADSEAEYIKRLSRYCQFTSVVIQTVKKGKSLSIDEVKRMEGEKILKELKPTDSLVLLDEKGTEFTSVQFADWIKKWSIRERRSINFVVGGAYGFSEEVYKRANQKIALSKLTFAHEMVRSVFLEQLYRAFTIIKKEPYHHE